MQFRFQTLSRRVVPLLAVCVAFAAMFAVAQQQRSAAPPVTGKIGMKAPAINPTDWIKGKAVDVTDGKGIYVVEFWATWCAPCKITSPHLSALQKKYADQGVTIIGITDEDAATARRYVADAGDSMAYTVASDTARRAERDYKVAFGAETIPYAFIVDRSGAIVWQGHPMDGMEEVLDAVVKGAFSIEDAKRAAMMPELLRLWLSEYLLLARYDIDVEEMNRLAERILAEGAQTPEVLHTLSRAISSDDMLEYRDFPLALRAANAALEALGEDNPVLFDALAVALLANGQIDEARTHIDAALALAGNDPQIIPFLEQTKIRIEAAQKAKSQ